MRKIAIVLSFAALILMLAGCGSSSNDAADTTATVESVDTSATDTTAATDTTGTDTSAMDTTATDTTATDTTATDTTATDTTATDTTTTTTTGIASGKCKDLVAMSSRFSQALSAAAGDKGDIETAAQAYKAFAEQAPEEVRESFKTVADAFAGYAEVVKDAGISPGKTPDAKAMAKLLTAVSKLSTPKLQAAEAQISAWSLKNCGTGG